MAEMIRAAARRTAAMFLRYAILHRRSVPRTLEIVFWPVMDLLVWGFVGLYVQGLSTDPRAQIVAVLVNAMIFWDILYRSQQSISISFTEDIWTQNILNLLVSPLRIKEWVFAAFLYGLAKTTVITVLLSILAWTLYSTHVVAATGFYLIPLMANLLFFGWAVGIFTSSLVIRWGHAAEALNWGIPFLIQPLSAVFYPVAILPAPLQAVARLIPSTYVFEGMRAVIKTGAMPWQDIAAGAALNVVWFAAGAVFFQMMYKSAYRTGRLGKLGVV